MKHLLTLLKLVRVLIKKHKSDVLEIKVSGGIKNSKDAIKFIEAGATRIGTSHGIDVIKGDE